MKTPYLSIFKISFLSDLLQGDKRVYIWDFMLCSNACRNLIFCWCFGFFSFSLFLSYYGFCFDCVEFGCALECETKDIQFSQSVFLFVSDKRNDDIIIIIVIII